MKKVLTLFQDEKEITDKFTSASDTIAVCLKVQGPVTSLAISKKHTINN